ncbi:MAG: signal recognition particle subunit SRP19/SEC65 family protein [Thermoplasmatota archaeon]
MVSKRDGKLVLWPLYFDRNISRPWRRVPLDLCVEEPTADEIARIVQGLRMKPILEKDIAHPSRWYDRSGRVLVDVRGSKSVLVRQIAEGLVASRKAAPVAAPKATTGRRR